MKASSIFQWLLLLGLWLWSLTATCMSQPNIAPSLPTDVDPQVQLATDTNEPSTLYGLLDSKSTKVQLTVLTRLGEMTEPQAGPRILDFLAAINITVEGSEDVSVNLNLKRLAIAAFESNTGQQFGAVDLHNISDIESHIEHARKNLGVSIPTHTTNTEPNTAALPSPVGSVTQKPTSSLPVQHTPTPRKSEPRPAPTPSEEPASSTPWSVIVVIIGAALGLLWLLLKRRS